MRYVNVASLLLSIFALAWSLALFFDEFIVIDYGFPLGLYYIGGLMLIGSAFVKGHIFRGTNPTILILLLIFLALAIGSIFFSSDYLKSIFWLFFILYNVIFIAALCGLVYKNSRSMNVPAFVKLSAIVVVLFGVYAYASGSLVNGRLVFHAEQNPAYLGGGMCLLIISLWIIAGDEKKAFPKFLSLLLIPCLLVLLLLTQARNPLVSMVVAFAFASITMFMKRVLYNKTAKYNFRYVSISKITIFFSLVLLAFVSVSFIDKFEFSIDRVMLLFSKDADVEEVTAGRFSRWVEYLSFSAHNFWPQGLGCAKSAIPGLGDPHNVFLRILVELSVLGLVVFIIFHVYLIFLTLKTDSIPLVWLATYLLLIGLGNDVIFQRDYWFGLSLLCLFYSLLISENLLRKRELVRGDSFA